MFSAYMAGFLSTWLISCLRDMCPVLAYPEYNENAAQHDEEQEEDLPFPRQQGTSQPAAGPFKETIA